MDNDQLLDVAYGVLPIREMALKLYAAQARPADDYRKPTYDVIVFETWKPRPINGSMDWIRGDSLLSAQFVGMLRLCGWIGLSTLVGFGPDRKTAFHASMPAELKAMAAESSEQHPADALFHLWGYFNRNWRTGRPDAVEITLAD